MWRLPTYQDLTPDQKAVIDLPLDVPRLVTGPPGSGKTVMAVYRAQALSRAKEPTILLMFGKLLSLYTRGALRSLNIAESSVTTYHSWFPRWFKAAYGRHPPMVDRWTFDWTGCFGIVGANPPPERLRTHVIVDEGQDMPPAFYMVLRAIARSMTVFADENQILTEANSTNEQICAAGGITSRSRLERNFRNTRAIANVSSHFWTGAGDPPVELRDSAEDGDAPVLDHDATLSDTIQRIATFEKANSKQQIGVLLPYAPQVEKFFNRLKGKTRNGPEVYLSEQKRMVGRTPLDFAKPGVKILTWASGKGLEFDTVFLPELQAFRSNEASGERFRMRMYVLTSRAKRELYFLYSGEGEPPIISTLPLARIDDWR